MTVSCIIWLFVVVGFHWLQYLWIIPLFFQKRRSHLNLFFFFFKGQKKEKQSVNAVLHSQLVPSCTSKAECLAGWAELGLMCCSPLSEPA